MIRAFAIFITALTMLTQQAYADGGVFDITVKADTTKANGSPWDGVPGLGNSKLNINAAPDIAVCVVKTNAKPDCIWRPDGRRLFSLCQNAWTCKFPGVALQPLPIGLVLIDIDARNHDIIDVLILTGNNGPEANAEIAASLRAAMTFLTPNRSEDSKEHVVKNAKIIPLGDCDSGKLCRLTQSEIKLERAK
jgi:hypothetical protein